MAFILECEMRTLILLIVISAFLIWFGVNFRQANRKYAYISLTLGTFLAILALLGMLGLV